MVTNVQVVVVKPATPANYFPLSSGAGAFAWSPTLPAGSGGTGFSSYTLGDMLYASGATSLAKLAIGSAGQVMTVSGGLPSWQPASSGSTLLPVSPVQTTAIAITTAYGLWIFNPGSPIAPTMPLANSVPNGTVLAFLTYTSVVTTLTCSGADTMTYDGISTTVFSLSSITAGHNSVTFVSDGTSIWYGISGR